MTNPTENTPADPAEIDRLRAHSTQLLGELKAAKAKVTSLQAQLATATEERDAARQEVRTLRLAPARTLLEHVALPGTADIVAKMLEQRGYTFLTWRGMRSSCAMPRATRPPSSIRRRGTSRIPKRARQSSMLAT